MYVCIIWFDLYLTGHPNSLKGKRRVIRSLKEKLISKYKVSVAEVGEKNLWQRSELGISFVCSQRKQAERAISNLVKFVDAESEVEIIDIFKDIEKIK